MKKLSIFLSALCLCAFTYKATAQFSGGNGSENNPYIITTAEEFVLLGTLVESDNDNFNDKCYKLGNDISLSAYQSGAGWKPIGYVGWFIDHAFHGVLDGDNKKITGLVINNTSLMYAGLFGAVTNGTVKNITIENVNIKADSDIGGVSGYIKNTTITNCYTSGKINGVGAWGCGGIVGCAYGCFMSDCNSTCEVSGGMWVGGVAGNFSDFGTMKNCYSTGDITGNSGSVGGLVGDIEGTVSYCYSTGKVTSGGDQVGGVTGYLGGSLSNCYSTSDVIGYNTVGGIAGYVRYGASVSNCYSTGKIIGNTNQVGGIAGYVDWEYISGTVSNCVALNPSVNATGNYVGRVVGLNDLGELTNNAAWDGMETIYGNKVWFNIGANKEDGVNMSNQTIQTDGTLGYRFMNAYGWTTQNGKLPGLFGKPVEMPAHLGGVGIDEQLQVTSYELQVYPNPTNGELRVTSDELQVTSIEVFDVYGRKYEIPRFARNDAGNSTLGVASTLRLDISHLPAGIYFLKFETEKGPVMKKVVKQ
ncbi:MAG: T9SS type A sorting domain-containing protein [Bacteroidales bacterium]|jgi:hypothetical protein|nr:T9SS type A sorting domain-containing protein [Bacteroidales bacterium]